MFIIAPNYFSFRREAHYHVPWLPLMPKSLARIYLALLKRKSSFLNESIFYVTSFGVKKFLLRNGFRVTTDLSEKVLNDFEFKSQRVRVIVSIFQRLGLKNFLASLIFFKSTHPMSHSIDLIAIKKK